MLWLFLGVQVVEVAEELVEAVIGRQVLVEITEMILAVLGGHITVVLEQSGNRRVFLRQALLGARQADFQEARAKRALPRDKGRTSGGATLLAIPVGEQRAFAGDAVNVGCLVSHHAAVVGAGVHPADVITPDDEDIRLVLSLRCAEREAADECKQNSLREAFADACCRYKKIIDH